MLPYSVVFAQRQQNRIAVLNDDIQQPNRSLGVLRKTASNRARAVERFCEDIVGAFDDLKHVVRRHERDVVWGAGPGEAGTGDSV